MVRQDDWLKSKLVDYGYTYGAEYGGHLGACLIMSVLANRQRIGWGSWAEVLGNADKFHAHDLQTFTWPQIWGPQFVRLLQEVDGIFDGTQDYAKGGVYWCDSAKPVTNEWFKEKILGNHDIHPIIGNMNSLLIFK